MAAGSTLAAAHNLWQPEYLPKIATLSGFPRQPNDAVCPAGLVRVTVDCVERTVSGSWWDFAGYYLSLLLCLPESCIWDARGEPTP